MPGNCRKQRTYDFAHCWYNRQQSQNSHNAQCAKDRQWARGRITRSLRSLDQTGSTLFDEPRSVDMQLQQHSIVNIHNAAVSIVWRTGPIALTIVGDVSSPRVIALTTMTAMMKVLKNRDATSS